MNELASRIRLCRKRTPMTQEEAAAALGMSFSTYNRREKSGDFKIETFIKMAEVFHVPLEHLLIGFPEYPFDPIVPITDLTENVLPPEWNFIRTITPNEINSLKIIRTLSSEDTAKLNEFLTDRQKKRRKRSKTSL